MFRPIVSVEWLMMREVLFDSLFFDDFDTCEKQDFLLKFLPAYDSIIFFEEQKYLFFRRKIDAKNGCDSGCLPMREFNTG
jgi:hypothetical protein